MIPLLKRFFDFFVFSSLFLAFCAVMMVYQTAILFHFRIEPALFFFIFCGTVCSYNFHWLLTPPAMTAQSYKLIWNIAHRQLHLLLSIAGLLGATIAFFILIEHWFWLVVSAFFTFLYSAPKIPHLLFVQLRKIAIGKTIFLALAWAHITSSLPLLIELKSLNWDHVLFVGNRFFFIYAICIVFDRRDVQKDRDAGIRSLITILNSNGIDWLFRASIMLTLLTLLLLSKSFSPFQISALLLPVVFLCLLYEPSKKNFSDYLFYFLLDGLMALSASILILATFAP